MTDENTNPTEEKATPAATKEAPKTPSPEKKDAKSDDQAGDRKRRGGRSPRNNRRKEAKEFEETIIGVDRVTRVTAGGRQMRFRVTVAIGDKKGRVGFGMGKSAEVMIGVQKAISQAKKRMITVPIYQDSIPHAITHKFKATKVFLLPAPEGKGVIAGGTVRKILELAGVKNVLSKIHGSRNKITTAYATIEALGKLANVAPPASKETEKTEEPDTKTEKSEAPKETPKTEKKKAPTKKAPAKKPAAQKAAPKKKA